MILCNAGIVTIPKLHKYAFFPPTTSDTEFCGLFKIEDVLCTKGFVLCIIFFFIDSWGDAGPILVLRECQLLS